VTRGSGGYRQLNIPGAYHDASGVWYEGVFEIGKKAGEIVHWFFRPTGG
jgi:hypothetical protein